MEKQEIIESLDRLINQIDVLKADSGPKSNDFIKWVREVKQFIEKAYGADYQQLRAFKKIDYYPKQFDILSSESAFKKAWIEGLMQADVILNGLKADAVGVPKEEKKESPAPEAAVQAEQKSVENAEEVKAAADTPVQSPAKEAAAPKEESKREEKKSEEKRAPVIKGQKVLIVNISDEKLNENIFTFIKKMGYEPVVLDYDAEGDVFVTDILNNSMDGDPVYAIIHWRGEVECDGKKLPRPWVIFSTGYYVAKLTNKRVLIISSDDIDCYDENYSGLNFLVIDKIQELMELKLAKEMDASGLNIDFNFLKKK